MSAHHHHEHEHGHHHHPHSPVNYNRAFMVGIVLNTLFVVIEFLYGIKAESLALVADAGHNLSDVAGLFLAWGAFWLGSKKPTHHFTFGLKKSSILSALFNSLLLLVAVGIIIWEAIERLRSPSPVATTTVMVVATIGIIINSITALLFFKDKDHDLNLKGAYLHMAGDALISLGVVVSGAIIVFTKWHWVDPVMSLLISAIIIYGTWSLLKDSLRLSLGAVPDHVNPHEVRSYLASLPQVVEVHDLHIWAIGTTDNALSAHLVLDSREIDNNLYREINEHLAHHYDIQHVTVQLEKKDEHFHCALKSEEVV